MHTLANSEDPEEIFHNAVLPLGLNYLLKAKPIFKERITILNYVQKFCCNGFSKFLLLFVILGPTSL